MSDSKMVTFGLVLRATDTKETDKILTVLTPDFGKISVIAKGARSKKSKYTAACQLFTYAELSLSHSNGWYYLTEASTVELFEELRTDIVLLSLASYLGELAESLCGDELAVPEILSLLLNALYALTKLKKDPQQVKAAFSWRLMAISGFEPMIDGCAVCGKETPERPVLNVLHGVIHCASCKMEGGINLPMTNSALEILEYVLYGDVKRLYSFKTDPNTLNNLNKTAEGFIAAQLERNFKTLDYYKAILPPEV